MENNRSKEKSPRYIEVYNQILKNIIDGVYMEENKLPNENKLARQMNVSRMTLRQALKLLQEDGVIESRKGVGNFLRNKKEYESFGLERIGDVLKKCGVKKIDKCECFPVLKQAALYTDQLFERHIPILLSVNTYYFADGKCCAQSYSTVATDIPSINQVDMLDKKQVSQFLADDIYKETKVASIEIRMLRGKEEHICDDLLEESDVYMMVSEKLVDQKGNVLCLNKYYIPFQNINIHLKSLPID